jgi:hypothetical protein
MRVLKRLAAGMAILLAASLPNQPAAREGDGLDLKYLYYWDRNGVWNHTPAIALVKSLAGAWKFRYNQEVDAVSGASRRLGLRNIGRQGDNHLNLDAISGASRRELRHSEKAGLAYAGPGRTASASFYYSDENDFTSYSPAVGGSWDINDRNTTLGADLSLFFDRMRPLGGFAGMGGDRRITSASLTLAQVLTPISMAGITVNGIRSGGYLGHPYNPVVLTDGTLSLEHLPDRKNSVAVLGQFIQGYRLGQRLGSARLEIRHYRDDWELRSNTADVQIYQYFTESAYVRLRARGYQQEPAAFARDVYTGDEVYRTSDIRFYGFSSLTLGLKLGSAFPEGWKESGLLPDRWDMGYDHGIRDTRGEAGTTAPNYHYQLYDQDAYYLQGTLMMGLSFDL